MANLDTLLRQQLADLLRDGNAHLPFAEAIADFPIDRINDRPANVAYSYWHLIEHLRLTQRDIIDYLADPEVIDALKAFESYVVTETLANALVGHPTAGASDQVEPESVEGPGGAVGLDGDYRDQIEVGRHQVRIVLSRTVA